MTHEALHDSSFSPTPPLLLLISLTALTSNLPSNQGPLNCYFLYLDPNFPALPPRSNPCSNITFLKRSSPPSN